LNGDTFFCRFRYFLLVVKLMANALVEDGHGGQKMLPVLVQAYQSDRVIVRASNPGQFEQPESEVAWLKTAQGCLAFSGQVCIGTTQPERDAQLTVMGACVL
jgi:predicted component of type VI protein secretion system